MIVKTKKIKLVGPFAVDANDIGDKKTNKHLRNEISVVVNYDDGNKTMLPFCAKDLLLSPDAIVRGSLFGLGTHETIKKKIDGKWSRIKKRLHYPQGSPKECGEFGPIRISYIGESLDQGDLDVWLRLIYLAKDNLTKTISISFNQLLAEVGRSSGGAAYENLNASLERLSTGHIKLQSEEIKVIDGVALIKRFKLNEISGLAEIQLNEDTARLFSTDKSLGWTRIQKKHRENLSGYDLALWLHAFYSSHAKPIPFKISTLHTLSGSGSLLKEFKRMLTGSVKVDGDGVVTKSGALNELVKIGFLLNWKVDDNIIFVNRDGNTTSSSQLSYIESIKTKQKMLQDELF